MKKLTLFMLLLLIVPVMADLTYDETYYIEHMQECYSGNTATDVFYLTFAEMIDYLEGDASFPVVIFDPSEEPASPSEGMVYYDSSGNTLMLYTGAAFVSIDTAGASSLDTAYGIGSAIDVDTDAVTLTVSDTDDNGALALVQNDATNDPNALLITMGTGSTGNAILIDSQTNGTDITGDNWSVTQAGVLAVKGITNTAADVTLTGTDYNVVFDTSESDLEFADSAALEFGTGEDISIYYTGGTDVLAVAGAGKTISIGVDGDAPDLYIYSETAGDKVLFDEDNSKALFTDYDIHLDDDAVILLGTGASSNGDFQITGNSSPVLAITQVAADTGTIEIGADGTDIPTKWYAETAGDYFQITGDDVVLEDVSLVIAEGTQIQFGDPVGTGDVTLSCTSNVFTIGQVVAGTGELALGADNKGVDTTFYAETSGDYVKWDQDGASNLGALIFEDSVLQFAGANVTYSEAISTDTLAVTATDHANAKISIAASGGTTNGIDVVWNAHTNGAEITLDGGGDTATFDGVDIIINDDDILNFGDSKEFAAYYDETTTDNLIVVALNANDAVQVGDGTTATDFICQSTADASAQVQFDASGDTANGEWLFGADDHGIDATFFGATASQKVYWDQSADTWYFGADAEGVDVYMNADTTGDYVLWDESDEDLKFVGANLVLDSDSAIENPVVVVTDAAEYDVTAANSGKVHIITDLSQNTSIDLPAEASGLYYEFWYCGGAEEAHDHTIDSENNTNYFIGGVMHHDNDDGAVAAVSSDGNSNSKLTLNDIRDGTVVKVSCDGTNWYVTGTVNSDTAPAFADQ